ncbi:DUF4159 domain-containing protein [Shimia thalassica]|uniref:DUF4159 domain-containing protein n=1 Tax=Shimia thalassica TaxID=1715693 RepID=UPI00273349FD|nr:DUF4159 domain-containing protein [Shimia thalassica]MDP2493632.1 DUF4159 domain-containing protein [Shimia thalassica]
MIGGLPIGFAAPWVLLALMALPVIWFLLRAIPPAPVKRRFPGVILLLGLKDDDSVTDRTPWWLLLLRSLALAAVIIGLAGPLLNPTPPSKSDAPVLVLLDGSWGAAKNWRRQTAMVESLLDEAARQGRRAAILNLGAPEKPQFQPAASVKNRLPGVVPQPWQADAENYATVVEMLGEDAFDTIWMSDGLEGASRDDLLNALEARGSVRIVEDPLGVHGLAPTVFDDGVLTITAVRSRAEITETLTVQAHGLDPSGTPRILATVPVRFLSGETSASSELSLPAELRSRISRFSIMGQDSAGAVTLSDDTLKRREVALISGREDREGLELLSPLHYLRQALKPNADLIEGTLEDILPANPDVVVLADIAVLSPAEEKDVLEWVAQGGLLLRFAGPVMAASGLSVSEEDPLLPVRLRSGGRSVGGAMSWGEPKSVAPFPEGSPFFGLPIPDEVRVIAQVVAQPDPTLADRVIAELTDGTPMVTRKAIDQGQVVLFHVTANTEWSGLPLSGLFVQMLDRLAILSAVGVDDETRLSGLTWQPVQVLDGFGRSQEVHSLPEVEGDVLAKNALGPKLRPGLYQSGDKLVARNVLRADDILEAAAWPLGTRIEGYRTAPVKDISGWFLAAALGIMMIDVFASLAVSGRLWGTRVATVLLALVLMAPQADAQESRAIQDTREIALGHVLTGNDRIDQLAQDGLRGLSEVLFFRTSVEPSEPAPINLETDEISFYPFLFWPITPDQPIPSDEAYSKLNNYLRSGGMILFDTRDADVARFGAASPNGRKLQRIAASLDIPPLEPLPEDHVLTRTFYLLQDFPGRYATRDVWVEAAPVDAEKIEGMPFRNLNDGVTPVVIGGNDWASAWAMDGRGNALYPVGRGRAGERQRELAFRFGVNLVMHVLTGNYKSDQVHVPALLDRLGQ